MNKKSVGASSRTPFKHWILNAELGRQVGILARQPWTVPCTTPLLIVDMCAGDGEQTPFSEHTSPSIIVKHMNYGGVVSEVYFIEKAQHTFAGLKNNVESAPNVTLVNGDARDFVVPARSENQAVFINCDPNNVSEIPFSETFMTSLPQYSTMIVTLGCNVGGLKREVLEKREEWLNYVIWVTKILPWFHDLLLCSLVKDGSQWAYLIRIPEVWSAASAAKYIKKGNSLFQHGVTVYSYRQQPTLFDSELTRLFLVEKNGETR